MRWPAPLCLALALAYSTACGSQDGGGNVCDGRDTGRGIVTYVSNASTVAVVESTGDGRATLRMYDAHGSALGQPLAIGGYVSATAGSAPGAGFVPSALGAARDRFVAVAVANQGPRFQTPSSMTFAIVPTVVGRPPVVGTFAASVNDVAESGVGVRGLAVAPTNDGGLLATWTQPDDVNGQIGRIEAVDASGASRASVRVKLDPAAGSASGLARLLTSAEDGDGIVAVYPVRASDAKGSYDVTMIRIDRAGAVSAPKIITRVASPGGWASGTLARGNVDFGLAFDLLGPLSQPPPTGMGNSAPVLSSVVIDFLRFDASGALTLPPVELVQGGVQELSWGGEAFQLTYFSSFNRFGDVTPSGALLETVHVTESYAWLLRMGNGAAGVRSKTGAYLLYPAECVK
jgi:hypothetical protein